MILLPFGGDHRFLVRVGDHRWDVGWLMQPFLAEPWIATGAGYLSSRSRLSIVNGNIGAMHLQPDNSGALSQVTSQSNMLEMKGSDVTPDRGVAGYEQERT